MILFVGPLPPPVHGFSNINLQMLRHLQNKASVQIFNTAPLLKPKKFVGHGFAYFYRLKAIISFLISCLIKQPNGLYLGLSGGLGQIGDAIYLSIARIFGIKSFIHHHSFAYFNTPKPYNRLCMWSVKRAYHIVLCEQMAIKLSSLYSIEKQKIFVLSNSAFLEEPSQLVATGKGCDRAVTVGFLSNITLEKGIAEFFDVVNDMLRKGLPVKALIAGPISPEIQEWFTAMLAECKAVEYLGPVYEEDKDAFFQTIDFLLFPTKYKNEAEPVTILEALRYGVPVLACGRGCIFSMIDQNCGKVFSNSDEFVHGSVEYIHRVLDRRIILDELSKNAQQNFIAMRAGHAAQLASLVRKISDQEREP